MRRVKEIIDSLIDKFVQLYSRYVMVRSRSRAVIISLAAIVVFCVTYALILPAITMTIENALNQGGIAIMSQEAEGSGSSVAKEDGKSDKQELDPVSADSSDNSGDADNKEDNRDVSGDTDADEQQAGSGKTEEGVASDDNTTGSDGTAGKQEDAETTEDKKDDNKNIVYREGELIFESETDSETDKEDKKSEEDAYKITLTYGKDAKIPEGAELKVTELKKDSKKSDSPEIKELLEEGDYDDYLKQTAKAIGKKAKEVSYARFFDISIVYEGEKIQPEEGTAVDVKIELSDVKKRDLSKDLSVVHFGEEEEEVLDTKLEGKRTAEVSFEATGFSVYAIVDAPEPYEADAENVGSLDELEAFIADASIENKGLYLSYEGNNGKFYFSSNLNSKNCLVEVSVVDDAAVWFFEPVNGQEGQYYLYTEVGGVKKYLKKKNNDNNNNDIALSDGAGTAFILSEEANEKFYIKHANQNKWLQHSNGGGGIRFWPDNNNAANSQITMTYASSIVMPKDPYELDGQCYGIVYDSGSIFCTGLMSENASDSALKGQDMAILEAKGNTDRLFVPQDSDITEWTFTSIREDYYYLTTEVNGVTQYLTIQNGGAYLSSEPGEGSLIRVVPGTGNQKGYYTFSAGGYKLVLSGGDDSKAFSATTETSTKTLMKLAEKSSLTEDDYLVYTAKKIGASDPAEQVILYTRVWNGERYDFYAVDYDGSLIWCYDEGDVIKWVGNQYETAYWELIDHYNSGNSTTPNGYYDLKNTYTGQYIAPELNGNLFSDSEVNLNLDGRYYQEEYTTIRSWDNTYYSYAGLKIDLENMRVVPCPSAQSDDFYFAVVKESETKLTEVDTIDNDEFGISMKMIDFNNPIVRDRDSVQTEFFGRDSNKAGLLTTDIDEQSGYPGTTYNNNSLGNLFAGAETVNHLFIQSIYDESGYFEYDSTKNFAWLNGDEFKVYDQLATVERDGDKPTMKHGQFMPYNSLINSETGEPWPYSEQYTNLTDVHGDPLSENDPRYGEGLHEIPLSKADYFFGMEMSAEFTQTADGKDAWGNDIIFEFSGDDDFWFYVDGELVLDLGGVHTAMSGSVNFRTGVVTGRNGVRSTLRQIFERNYRARNPNASTEEVNEYLSRFFEDGETVFKDYSTHEMKIYFMERGAGASNLHMRFNLTALRPGEVTLSKKVSGSDDVDYDLMEFPYQIWYLPEGSEDDQYQLLTQDASHPAVTYQGSKRPVKYEESFTPVGESTPYNSVFFLKPGESASISMPSDTIKYKITECSVNMNIFQSVNANGETLSSEGDTGRKDYVISAASMKDRPEVEFENEVDPNSLRTLTITKILWDESGFTVTGEGTEEETKIGNRLNGYEPDATAFDMRIYLSALDSSELTPARNKEYYVKDTEQNYCKWDVQEQQFVSLGINDFSELTDYLESCTDMERAAIVFETSINGSASRIPGGYSIELRGLPIDSSFRVIEREDEIPAGYSLIEYERDKGSYISEEPNEGTIRANEDPHVLVHNKRGWGLSVKKVWSDADYMDSHDDIYFAVYIRDPEAADQPGEYTLLDGSVRKLTSPADFTYYYFDELQTDNSFDDYKVFEVKLTNPSVEQNGTIRYDAIERISEDGTLTIGGEPKGKDYQSGGFEYRASYTEGELKGENNNVREDTVTNTRRGVRLVKTDWNGSPLPGAVFTLKDNDGNLVGADSYTSDQSGEITIAYLDPATEYTLEEIQAPAGFQKPSAPWKITKWTNETVSVTGDMGSYEITQSTDETMAVVMLKNKGFSLQALKVAAQSGEESYLDGAVFALYKQVETVSGMVRDQNPMPGYESLQTDTAGVIPKITSALPAGTYYLSEVIPPSGYKQLDGDLVFIVSTTGTVEIPASVDSADPDGVHILNNQTDLQVTDWITYSDIDESGHISYTIRIPNELAGIPVRVIKTDQGGKALEGAVFSFTSTETFGSKSTSIVSEIPENQKDLTVEEQEAVIIPTCTVPQGCYTLREDSAPAGYIPLDKDVQIDVSVNPVTGQVIVDVTLEGESSAFVETELVDTNDLSAGWIVRIKNDAGVELPNAGGIGTTIFYVFGSLLFIGGAVLLAARKRIN